MRLCGFELRRPDIKMRSVSPPGTHHIVFSLNLRPHVYGLKFFFGWLNNHSLLRLFTGLINAALIAWKLTVAIAISTINPADRANSHHWIAA